MYTTAFVYAHIELNCVIVYDFFGWKLNNYLNENVCVLQTRSWTLWCQCHASTRWCIWMLWCCKKYGEVRFSLYTGSSVRERPLLSFVVILSKIAKSEWSVAKFKKHHFNNCVGAGVDLGCHWISNTHHLKNSTNISPNLNKKNVNLIINNIYRHTTLV